MDWNARPHQRGLPSNVGAQQARFLDSMGAPSLRHVNADGSTSIKNNGQLSVYPSSEEGSITLSRLCWMPEGIVLTPRTAENQLGWGLPPTEDGMGTVGGDFPYVVINKYLHNNTPEYLHTVYSGKETKSQYADTVGINLNWPLNYINIEPRRSLASIGGANIDDAGAIKVGSFLPQFISRYRPLLREKRQDEWFCHRAKVREFTNAQHELLFTKINEIRANATPPLPLFSKPIEGWCPDMAQAVVLVGVVARTAALTSANLSNGWGSPPIRYRFRAAMNASFGDVIYTHSGQGWDNGNAAIAFWENNAVSRGNILYDYTDGAREVDGIQNAFAEVVTLGSWRTTTMSNSGAPTDAAPLREVVASICAPGLGLAPFLATVESWANPIYGRIATLDTSASLQLYKIDNSGLSGMNGLQYKQLALITSNGWGASAKDATIGGAFVVSRNETPLFKEDEFARIIAIKAAREKAYNAKRLAAGEEIDDSCIGSESDLTSDVSAHKVSMRVARVVKVGGVFSLIMDEGEPHNFASIRNTIATINLPPNVISFSNAAQFSESGEKCLVAVGQRLQTATYDGEVLHFYEFSEGAWAKVAESQIPIDVQRITTGSPTYDYIEAKAEGTFKYIGYYDGETLKWAELEIDCESWHETKDVGGSAVVSFQRRLNNKMKLSPVLEWEYTNTEHSGVDDTAGGLVSGVVKHLLAFNPKYPEEASWIEYTFTPDVVAQKTTGTAVLKRNMIAPTVVKTLYTGARFNPAWGNNRPWLVPLSSGTIRSNQYVHPQFPHADLYTTEQRIGSFSLGAESIYSPAAGSDPHIGMLRATPFAPVAFSRLSGIDDDVRYARALGGYVVGGLLRKQPFGFGTADVPDTQPIYFKYSNLDLEQITGIAGLSDNILPLGSL